MPTMKLDGSKLKSLREECGLRQCDLARALNTGDRTVSRLENGMTNAQVNTISTLAKALDCTVSDLLTECDDEST